MVAASGDGGGGGIGMQPSEEFRPLPHIYLSARRSAARRGAEAAGPGSGPVRGAPFYSAPTTRVRAQRGSTNKEEKKRGTERNREGGRGGMERRTEDTYEASARPLLRP